jgi:hypothetical protein
LRGPAAQRFNRECTHVLFKPGFPDHFKLTTRLQNRALPAPSATTHNTRVFPMMFCENLNDDGSFTMLAHGQ